MIMARNPHNTRGYRNRNPGNIDRVKGVRWQGQIHETEEKARDPRFCVFKTHEHGIRAIVKTLITYATIRKARNGTPIDTVREVIERWAPPKENDTSAYVDRVAAAVGVTPDAKIDIQSPAVMRELVKAIIKHECWGLTYPEATIDAALRMAGIDVEHAVEETHAFENPSQPVPEVQSAEAPQEVAKSSNKLAKITAGLAAFTAALSAVTAELPKLAQTIDEIIPDNLFISVAPVWGWLPVVTSLAILAAIFLLMRQIRQISKPSVTNEL